MTIQFHRNFTTKLLVLMVGICLAPGGSANPRVVANTYAGFEVNCPNNTAPTGCYEAKNACRPAAKVAVRLPAQGDKWLASQAGLAAFNLCEANRRYCPSSQITERCCATQCVALLKLSSGAETLSRCLQGCIALE
jgi:hypothetical protein